MDGGGEIDRTAEEWAVIREMVRQTLQAKKSN
jgi:hypothetical protein